MGTAAASNNLKEGFPTPGPQEPTGSRVMDHVFFLSNEQWKEAREENNYDLVVVGSGFCGYAVARRALENNPKCRVLIIERGPFFLPEHFQNLPIPFVQTLGGMSETFPWTVSRKTASGEEGTIRWQHGMVPFFGGRSTLWSAWCPRPTRKEMAGWPDETIEAAERHFAKAEELLKVIAADEIDSGLKGAAVDWVVKKRPVYGALQRRVQKRLKAGCKKGRMTGVYRTEAAPLAADVGKNEGIDFQKYAVPGPLLEWLIKKKPSGQKGPGLDIVTECVVEEIIQQEGVATALRTSRGVLPLGKAKLVLAMGTLPPTTLARNSFPDLPHLGERFSAHFITAVVARVKRDAYEKKGRPLGQLELGACYVAGTGQTEGEPDFTKQFHVQLTALSDRRPKKNAQKALRYMPDVVATASMEQLESSKKYVVFVCAVLGELDYANERGWFRRNPQDPDPTTNSLLQVSENQNDRETWDAMDEATFEMLEDVLADEEYPVEYWHAPPDSETAPNAKGTWERARPSKKERRVDALVHESSTLHLGKEENAPVGLDYRLKGTSNVYITGGALWPQGGSWNPTMTMVALALDLADRLIEKVPGHE